MAISREIATQYLTPFRSAGFQCGLITISGLAALSLDDACPEAPPQWIQVKRAGRVLSVCLVDRGTLRMFRCVELDHATVEEMIEVLAPTIAYAEDEFGARPARLRLCGFPAQERDGDRLGAELELRRGADPLAVWSARRGHGRTVRPALHDGGELRRHEGTLDSRQSLRGEV